MKKGYSPQLELSRAHTPRACTSASYISIERLHVTSHVQVVVYSLGLTVLIYGTLAYLRMKLFLKTKRTYAE